MDEAVFNEIRDTLWYQLGCKCRKCGVELDLLEFEPLKQRDAMAWSCVAAERAVEQGWYPVPAEIGVLCPGCGKTDPT